MAAKALVIVARSEWFVQPAAKAPGKRGVSLRAHLSASTSSVFLMGTVK